MAVFRAASAQISSVLLMRAIRKMGRDDNFNDVEGGAFYIENFDNEWQIRVIGDDLGTVIPTSLDRCMNFTNAERKV